MILWKRNQINKKKKTGKIVTIGITVIYFGKLCREIFFIKMIKNANYKIFYSDIGDFEVNGSYFKIGGKNKSINQIKNHLNKSFLVKDDIMFGSKYEIPLYLFGFIY